MVFVKYTSKGKKLYLYFIFFAAAVDVVCGFVKAKAKKRKVQKSKENCKVWFLVLKGRVFLTNFFFIERHTPSERFLLQTVPTSTE